MDLSGFAGSQVILTYVYFDVCQAGEPMEDYDATKSQRKCYVNNYQILKQPFKNRQAQLKQSWSRVILPFINIRTRVCTLGS